MTADGSSERHETIGETPVQPSPADVWRDALRVELQETLHEGYAGVSRDFDQMQNLFEDVVCDLNRVLQALNGPAPGATAAADTLPSSAPDGTPGLAAGSEKANLMLHLVTVLQFEDIASQILQRARSRLVLLEGFTNDMLFGSTAHATCQRPGAAQGETQRELRKQIERHRDEVRAVMERGVRQQSMDAGEVVLF